MANVHISAYFGAQRLLFFLRNGTHTSKLMKTVTTDGTCGQETVLLAPLHSPDARLQIRLNRLVLNRWVLADSYSTTKCVLLIRVSEEARPVGNEDLTYGAVGCNFPSFGVVSQQLQLSFRRLPHWIFLSNTWCFREFLRYICHKATYEYPQHLFFYRNQCFYSGKDAFKATAKTYNVTNDQIMLFWTFYSSNNPGK